ncbi:T6SS effector amidase Tae4 family protein [Cupriavidus sp. 2KB_3]|uniref:T6SS effector amidase Tae4 family protein n=1 Tax=Cupriavidus sp. 2KB_3 TaxID=3232980 RepID=UPI003F8E5608
MKPAFMAVQSNYQSRKTVIKEQLFAEIGWEDLIPKPEYNNTCAIRVSLALIKCGFTLNGRIAIKKGKYKGKLIEPGQAKLARMLAERQYLGPPEIFPRDDALRSIGSRRGVIAFWNIPDYMSGRGGHIDIVTGAYQACGSTCFWDATTIWFWPLT